MILDKEELKQQLLKSKIELNNCWYWGGLTLPAGYGKLYIARKPYMVHRLSAYIWLDFDLNSELFILHKCDNPRCFNPEHLVAGTAQDNQDDFFNKGFKRKTTNQFTRKEITRCQNGHERNEVNTRTYVDKGKVKHVCRVCRNVTQKIWRS